MSLLSDMGLIEKEKRKTEYIDVSLLDENPDNFYAVDDVSDLKAAIVAAGGVRLNLIVQPENNGRYKIISGHRRCKAVRELLKEKTDEISSKVPCEIETDETIAQILLITTNSTARRLNTWERLEQFKRLEEIVEDAMKSGRLNGRKRDAIAGLMHENKTNVARIQAINNRLCECWDDYLENNRLGISAAYEISKESRAAQEAFEEYCYVHDVDSVSLPLISEFFKDYHEKESDDCQCTGPLKSVEKVDTEVKTDIPTVEAVQKDAAQKTVFSNAKDETEKPEKKLEKMAIQTGDDKPKEPEPPLKRAIKKIIKKYEDMIRPQITLSTAANYIQEIHSTDVDYIGLDDNNGNHLYARDFVKIEGLFESKDCYYGMIYYDQADARYLIGVFMDTENETELLPCTFSSIKGYIERLGNASFEGDVEKMCRELMTQ